MKLRLKSTLLTLCVLLMAAPAFAACPASLSGFTCFYISFTNGSDSNNGATEGTPWKRAPFMQGVTGTAAAHTPAYGDAYVFEGGDVWPNSVFGAQVVLTPASTSTSPVGCAGTGCVYIGGGDTTWFISANCVAKSYVGYCRPVFDGQSSPVATFPGGISVTFLDIYGGGDNSGSGGYMIVDNLEFTGLNQASNTGVPAYIAKRCGKHCEIKNNYFHGWSHGGTATQDNARFISGVANCPQDTTSSFHDNVFDGSDTTEDMGMALAGGFNYVYNNYITHMHNGVLGANQFFYQNTITHINGSFDATSHGNVFEVTVGCSTNVWNNRIDDATGGATLFPGPKQGGPPDFYFNNLITSQQNQSIQVASNLCGVSCTGTGEYIFNNVIQQVAANSTANIAGAGDAGGLFIPFMTINNNLLIQDTSNFIIWGRTTTQNSATNITETNASATSAGYVQSGSFWYFPPSVAGQTVGVGTNETTAICNLMTDPNLATPVEDCKSDSTYGVGYDAVNHAVIVAGRTANARPSISAWDVGPFQFAAGNPAFSVTTSPGATLSTGAVIR